MPRPEAMPPRKIVVVMIDDQAIVGETLRYMLADQTDMSFHYCSDPARSVDLIRSVGATVILQDLMMPGVDGLELLRVYRGQPQISDIPVIVLSSREQPLEKSRAFGEGATDYLVKIPDKIELTARIRAHSRTYLLQRERDEAYRALDDLRKRLEESNAALERLSNQDGLTGLANRRHFDEVLASEWARACRTGAPLSMVLMDVDHFKKFNDAQGHLKGDACLSQVASCLRQALSRTADLAARYGGEEFVALLPDTPVDGSAHVAVRIRDKLAELALPHGHPEAGPLVTISQGVATLVPDPSAVGARLIAMADEALYVAKREGRNRHQVHPESSRAPGPPRRG